MKIIVALDNLNFEKAFAIYVELAPSVDGFKVNHTLLEHTNMFVGYEGEIFVDCKLWDTPNTVCSVVEYILEKGATMTTISTFNNQEVFKSLLQYSEDIKFLGVTYLTSWSTEEQFKIARESKCDMWNNHIKRIRKFNFSGIVCSARDIEDIDETDKTLLRVCPGITFKSSNSGQVRIASPRCAEELGADYAIIGRSITKTDQPLETLKMIKSTLRNTG